MRRRQMAKKRICAMKESLETQAELTYIREIARALAMHTDVWEDLAYQLQREGEEKQRTMLGYGAGNSKVYLPIDRTRHRLKGFTVANFKKKQGAFRELQGLTKQQGAFQELQGLTKRQGAFQELRGFIFQEQMSALGNGSLHRSDLADELYFILVRA